MRRGNFFPRLAEPHFSENMKLVASAREIADGVGCSLPQLAIAWVLAKGEEIVTIPGTKDIDHLEDNWGTMEVTLNAATVEQLDEIFAPENIAGPRYSEMGQKSVTTEMYEFEQV